MVYKKHKFNFIWSKLWLLEIIWYKWKKVICKCECWNTCEVFFHNMIQWRTTSCWCLLKKRYNSNISKNNIYKTWQSIKQRCNNHNRKQYKDYWWRWITYDKKRENFEWFYEDMWDTYKEWLAIDRINNDWNYCKENCRRISQKDNCNNRRTCVYVTYKWNRYSLKQLAEYTGISYYIILNRYREWYRWDDLFKLLWYKRKYITYNWETHTITEWSKKLWINRNTLKDRINKLGRSIEKSLNPNLHRNAYK